MWWDKMIGESWSTLVHRFGFASLHNVNQPSKRRDEMPSFFVAAPGLKDEDFWFRTVAFSQGNIPKLDNVSST